MIFPRGQRQVVLPAAETGREESGFTGRKEERLYRDGFALQNL
jgi:hypothetical protein